MFRPKVDLQALGLKGHSNACLLLQNYIFIPLDIFQKNIENDNTKIDDLSRMDAWLLFLSSDKTDDIILLIEQYPEFRPMYEHLFSICQNEERMMDMYRDELRIIDHNTVFDCPSDGSCVQAGRRGC